MSASGNSRFIKCPDRPDSEEPHAMTYHEPEQIQAIVNRFVRQITGQQGDQAKSDCEEMVIDEIPRDTQKCGGPQGIGDYAEAFFRGCVSPRLTEGASLPTATGGGEGE